MYPKHKNRCGFHLQSQFITHCLKKDFVLFTKRNWKNLLNEIYCRGFPIKIEIGKLSICNELANLGFNLEISEILLKYLSRALCQCSPFIFRIILSLDFKGFSTQSNKRQWISSGLKARSGNTSFCHIGRFPKNMDFLFKMCNHLLKGPFIKDVIDFLRFLAPPPHHHFY